MKDDKNPRLQEVTPGVPEPESPSDCEFCSLLCRSKPSKGPAESSSLHFMTEREFRVLDSMRRLKEQISGVRARMREMEQQGASEDRLTQSAVLEDLREEWKKLDRERMEAAEERMRLLGHIQ